MMNFVLATVPFVMKIVVGVWVLLAFVLVLIVLIQKGRGGGLSSTFGGLSNSLLGTKTGDFLTWVTISVVALWLLLSIVAAKFFRPQTNELLQGQRQSAPVQQQQQQAPVPPAQEQPAQSQPQQNSPTPETSTPTAK
jgi:preprotein translocase subunit SecG